MLEISRFFGIVIKMFFSDHAPLHFQSMRRSSRSRHSKFFEGNCRVGRSLWSGNGPLPTARTCEQTGTAPGPARPSSQSRHSK